MAKKVKNRNPVAKFSHRFNKAVTMVDRKKEQKKTGNIKGQELLRRCRLLRQCGGI